MGQIKFSYKTLVQYTVLLRPYMSVGSAQTNLSYILPTSILLVKHIFKNQSIYNLAKLFMFA
jgi:hypothetical protein